ncbi:hypothetical protein PMAC_000639 [Pneumocystis sp. 'macacae']|nr:hypothetical protein PMAC_000639 [Pneumocystis sp. 'macacae']
MKYKWFYDLDFDFEDDKFRINVENKYYLAKEMKQDDPFSAIKEFKQVILLETTKGNWGFRSLKQIMKLLFHLGYKHDELLTYVKSSVTKNYSEKSIHNILDYISLDNDVKFMEEIYSITLDSLEEIKNERLLLKTNLKLAKLCLDKKEYIRLNRVLSKKILSKLYSICEDYDGLVDQLKEAYLLELYSLEMQMYYETKNNKRLKDLYNKALKIKSANIHPYIMGVIKECAGKMYMDEKRWEEALTDFFESFKNYEEVGSPNKIRVLKYSILANMLNGSSTDMFYSKEMNSYKNDPQFLAMINLEDAYQERDIRKIESILKEYHNEIMEDAFIRVYIDDILWNIRSQILVRLISSYTQISISFIEKELNITSIDVEALLINLILDEHIQGKIDQVNQILTLKTKEQLEEKDITILALAESVNKLWRLCLNRQY